MPGGQIVSAVRAEFGANEPSGGSAGAATAADGAGSRAARQFIEWEDEGGQTWLQVRLPRIQNQLTEQGVPGLSPAEFAAVSAMYESQGFGWVPYRAEDPETGGRLQYTLTPAAADSKPFRAAYADILLLSQTSMQVNPATGELMLVPSGRVQVSIGGTVICRPSLFIPIGCCCLRREGCSELTLPPTPTCRGTATTSAALLR
eukprot:SAG22_NODE_1883_length_3378_cov_3.332723_1_plen_203_part_00